MTWDVPEKQVSSFDLESARVLDEVHLWSQGRLGFRSTNLMLTSRESAKHANKIDHLYSKVEGKTQTNEMDNENQIFRDALKETQTKSTLICIRGCCTL